MEEDRLEITLGGFKAVNSKGIATVEVGPIIIRDLSYLDAAIIEREQLKAILNTVEEQINKLQSIK